MQVMLHVQPGQDGRARLRRKHTLHVSSPVTRSRGHGAATRALERFSLPYGPGTDFPAHKHVFELGRYYATSAHEQLPFLFPFPRSSSHGSTVDARAAQGQELGLFALLRACHASTAWCAARRGSQSPQEMFTTTTALFIHCLSLPAPACHPDTHKGMAGRCEGETMRENCSGWPSWVVTKEKIKREQVGSKHMPCRARRG